MKNILILILFPLLIQTVSCKKELTQTAIIKSSNIGCSHCVENIKKAIFTLEGIKDVNVDVDKKTVEVEFAPTQTNIQTIEIAMTRAGYDANERKRDPEAYENLDDCCKHGY